MKNLVYFLFISALVGFMISCGGNEKADSAASKSSTTESVSSDSKDATASSGEKSNKDLPPSQRADMVNRGVGPFADVEVEIPDEIDRKLAVQGKQLFDTNCTACHAPDKTLIGPAPKGILDIRTPQWIMNMIVNPDEMLAKDPLAKEVQEEFNGQIMTDMGITEEGARAILEYFRTL